MSNLTTTGLSRTTPQGVTITGTLEGDTLRVISGQDGRVTSVLIRKK